MDEAVNIQNYFLIKNAFPRAQYCAQLKVFKEFKNLSAEKETLSTVPGFRPRSFDFNFKLLIRGKQLIIFKLIKIFLWK